MWKNAKQRAHKREGNLAEGGIHFALQHQWGFLEDRAFAQKSEEWVSTSGKDKRGEGSKWAERKPRAFDLPGALKVTHPVLFQLWVTNHS